MSDFPELEDFSGAPVGSDPTSDFLARERALLGNEFGDVPQDYESVQPPSNLANEADDQFGLGSFSVGGGATSISTVPPHVSVTGNHDDLTAFEDQYPDLSHEPALGSTNGYNAPAPSLYANPASQSYTNSPAVYAQTQMEEESEHIKEWRQKQAEEIRLRDERSAAKREETIAAAEKAIDDFYHGYNTQKEKNIARNKEQEALFLQKRDDSLGQGTTWQRITDLIELQDSRSKTASKSTHDLSRFKEILLSLKREGENAPGAAGY
ncbi:hypothetical protein CROQUDRAFT_103327 [Cronartium quercuum f. sp. fusiforme G11]|uniref:Clathrin light chain n=1 Tax=Cronartium quercuum f. sp. fusiforme G11 TaxID=708437 RepID=A0A9P6NX64_9BASI|nr:hypothetical protein CROQUDRAFT_103327 [Cronartium quercuum f. sp. fusiforme G11]